MRAPTDGNAILYCEGALGSTNGKTAHGLLRRTSRYRVLSVVDSGQAGRDAGEVLGDGPRSIPVFGSVDEAHRAAVEQRQGPTHLVVGLAPDGGRLDAIHRAALVRGVELGLNVDCGLHDYLNEDANLAALAWVHGVKLRDVRRPPRRRDLHFFSRKIEQVGSLRVAVLGSDSAVGKRTSAWLLLDALRDSGLSAELIGTGQTAWLQGARYCLVLDALPNDFVAGEIEHTIHRAWTEQQPDVLLLEGQGSLMNPAYPGGLELLAAGRPHCVVLQHAPARKDYDGFPGYPVHPLEHQIEAIRVLSGRPVVAVTINHEGLDREQARQACRTIAQQTGLPTVDPLRDGVQPVVEALAPFLGEPCLQAGEGCAPHTGWAVH
jgi:uncharacterized NAD-dependent epimerase/dehydratase family protein